MVRSLDQAARRRVPARPTSLESRNCCRDAYRGGTATPDVDRDLFLDLAELYPAYSERTTLYASQSDLGGFPDAVQLSETSKRVRPEEEQPLRQNEPQPLCQSSTLRLKIMLFQSMTARFYLEISVAIGLALVAWRVARAQHRDGISRPLQLAYFTGPANHAMSILGLVFPLLIALLSFLQLTNPRGNFSSLMAAITLFLFSLVAAAWLPFALLKKGSAQDVVNLTFPQDRRFITVTGWMWIGILTGLSCLVAFLLVEIPSRADLGAKSTINLVRPRPAVGQARDEVRRLLGTPDEDGSALGYQGPGTWIQMTFDQQGHLVAIHEQEEKRE